MTRYFVKLSKGRYNYRQMNDILFVVGIGMNVLALIIYSQTPPL